MVTLCSKLHVFHTLPLLTTVYSTYMDNSTDHFNIRQSIIWYLDDLFPQGHKKQ